MEKGKIILISFLIFAFALLGGTSTYLMYNKSNEVVEVASSSTNKSVQQKLKDLGYYKGGVDGIYGLLTREAVTNFQRD